MGVLSTACRGDYFDGGRRGPRNRRGRLGSACYRSRQPHASPGNPCGPSLWPYARVCFVSAARTTGNRPCGYDAEPDGQATGEEQAWLDRRWHDGDALSSSVAPDDTARSTSIALDGTHEPAQGTARLALEQRAGARGSSGHRRRGPGNDCPSATTDRLGTGSTYRMVVHRRRRDPCGMGDTCRRRDGPGTSRPARYRRAVRRVSPSHVRRVDRHLHRERIGHQDRVAPAPRAVARRAHPSGDAA